MEFYSPNVGIIILISQELTSGHCYAIVVQVSCIRGSITGTTCKPGFTLTNSDISRSTGELIAHNNSRVVEYFDLNNKHTKNFLQTVLTLSVPLIADACPTMILEFSRVNDPF